MSTSAAGGAPRRIREGLVECEGEGERVFYNPAQVVNRDLSVLVLRYYGHLAATERVGDDVAHAGLRVLEALAATGLRSLRYARETGCVASVVANDVDAAAVEVIRRNIVLNGKLADCVSVSGADAYALMASRRGAFDVVDLDPYGTAAPFLDPAVRAVGDGGLLCVTCTDARVLCGTQPEVCFARYHATGIVAPYKHEQAIRIVVGCIAQHANRYGRHVEPLLCLFIDFYVRVFVRVWDRRSLLKTQPSQSALVYHCGGCSSFWLQPQGRIRQAATVAYLPAIGPPVGRTCPVCHTTDRLLLAGPMYTGTLHAPTLCDWLLWAVGDEGAEALPPASRMGEVRGAPSMAQLRPHLAARDRIRALITVAREELTVNTPLYVHLPTMCRVLKCSVPPLQAVQSILRQRYGHASSQVHHDAKALKTDAPLPVVWDVLRCWAQLHGDAASDRLSPEGKFIRATTPSQPLEPPLTLRDFQERRKRRPIPRFPPNPTPHWGPKRAASSRVPGSGSASDTVHEADAPPQNGGESLSGNPIAEDARDVTAVQQPFR
eukprot:ctg_44.g13